MVIIAENKLEVVLLLESSNVVKKYKSYIVENYVKEILNNLIHSSAEDNTSYNLSLISFHERLSPTLCPIKMVECGSNINYMYHKLEKLNYEGTSSIHALTEAFKAAFSIFDAANTIDKKMALNNRICILICSQIPEDDPSLSLLRLNDLTLNKIFQKIKEKNIMVNVVSPKREESIKNFCEKVKMGPNDLKAHMFYNTSPSQDDRFVCFIQGIFISEKLVRGTSLGNQQPILNNTVLPYLPSQASDISNAQSNDDGFINKQHIPMLETNIQVKSEYTSPFQQSPIAITNPGSQSISQYGQPQSILSMNNAQFQSPQSGASPYAPSQGVDPGYRQQPTPNQAPINQICQQPQSAQAQRSQIQAQQQTYVNPNSQMALDQSGVNRTPYQQQQQQQYPNSVSSATPSPSYNPAVSVKQEFIQPEMAGQQLNQSTGQNAYSQQPQQNQSAAAQQARPLSATTPARVLWSGLLQWQEKQRPDASNINNANPSNATPPITTHSLMCRVSPMPGFEDLKTNSWPQNLLMQAIQQDIIHKLGHMFRNAKTLTLTFPNQEDTNSFLALNRLLTNNMAGCIMFPTTVPDIRVMILLYSVKKKSYIGLIPLDQGEFVNNIRKLLAAKREQQTSTQPGPQQGPQAQSSQMVVSHQGYQQHSSNMMEQQMQQSHQASHISSSALMQQQQQHQQSANMPQAGLSTYGAPPNQQQQSQMGNMMASANYQQPQQQSSMGSGAYGTGLPNYNAARMQSQVNMNPRPSMTMRQTVPGGPNMYQNQQQASVHPSAQQMNKAQLPQSQGGMYHQQQTQHQSHSMNPQQTNTQKLPMLPNIPSAAPNLRQSSNVQQGHMGSGNNQQQLRQLLMNPQAPPRNAMLLHGNYQQGNPMINNPANNQGYGGGSRMTGQHQNVSYQHNQSAPRATNINQIYGSTSGLNSANFGQNQQQGTNMGMIGNLNQGGTGNTASNNQILDNLMDIIQ